MYLDSAYIAKYYLNEPDSKAVRSLITNSQFFCSSYIAMVEVTCVFHRNTRENAITLLEGQELIDLFWTHVDENVWSLLPISDFQLRKTAEIVRSLPANVFLRAGDAIHLTAALDAGESEIWTSDRHLLAAAPHVGLIGKSVSAT